MNCGIHDTGRWHRASRRPALAAVFLGAGLCWAANAAGAATALLDFEFNEGGGSNVTDQASKLMGVLGPELDPAAAPVPFVISPGNWAVSLNYGNDTSQGFLVVDDGDGPILALATNAFTIETWINLDPNDTRQDEGLGAYGGSYKLGLDNGQLVFTLYGAVEIPSGLSIPPGAWHHAAAVWQPGLGVTFYLDGGSETPVAETRAVPSFANNILTIGADGLYGNAVQGIIDRFRIHNAALTAAQLDSVEGTPKPALASTLVAYGFNETATPYQSAGATPRPAISSLEYLRQLGSPTFAADTPSGKPGDYSLKFAPGQSAYVPDPNTAVALAPANPSFTVQSWVKFGAQPGSRSALFYDDSPGGAFSFSVTHPARHVLVSTLGIADLDSGAAIPNDGGWHHIAAVHENGKDFLFYIDGVLSATIPYTNGVLFTETNTSLTIGSAPGGGSQYVGLLDRLKVTAGVVSPQQLDYLPVAGVPLGPPMLTLATAVQVSWPGLPSGYVLQSSANLSSPNNWVTLTNPPFANNGTYYMVFPTTSTSVYYRLIKP